MMWYQPGGQLPDDVYTYKDAARGLNKLWSKVSRKKSNASSSASSENGGSGAHQNGDLLATEKEGKVNGNSGSEIQHIEETDILEENEDDEEIDHHEEIQGLGLKGLKLAE